MTTSKHPRIALVYDRVNTPHGGAEKVLLALHQLYPEAPLYTSVYSPTMAPWAKVFDVRPSFLQKLPVIKNHHRLVPHLMPLAFESLDLQEFEIVISISSAEAKGVLTLPHQLHIAYLLTPTRYLYSHQLEYLNQLPPLPPIKNMARSLLRYLEWWDSAAAFRPDVIIPISKLVATRTQTYYKRETEEPLYPPVSAPISLKPTTIPGLAPIDTPYMLVVSRLVSYKKVDLAIRACQQLEIPLVIVGEGPEKERLKSISTDTTQFLGHITDAQLALLYNNCTGLLQLGEEDFGITALEALSYGRPAVVHYKSGAAELIKPGVHGLHIKGYQLEGIMATIDELQRMTVKSSQLKNTAKKYQTDYFKTNFAHKVTQLWQDYRKGNYVLS